MSTYVMSNLTSTNRVPNLDLFNYHEWLHGTRVNVSRGKGHWSYVKRKNMISLAEWLEEQTSTKREGDMTAAQLAVASDESRAEDKASAGWFSFSAYREDYRNEANWISTAAAVLDLDGKYGDQEGSKYAFSRDDLLNRLDGLQFIALPTHSYTDEVPRWRIVIPLSSEVACRTTYAAITQQLAAKLSGYVDPCSTEPEKLWFNLSGPAGEWEKRLGLIVVGD